jgi:DNA-binding MltR family transcriptional regulator
MYDEVMSAMDYMIGMRAESDRGAVLVAASYIDDALERILRATFVDDSTAAGRLLEYPGPCSTLSSRSDLAYCCGLIGKDVYIDIRTITKIRNRFAHNREIVGFSDRDISDMCRNLGVIKGMSDAGTEFGGTAVRSLFLISAGAIILLLDHAASKAKDRPMGPSLKDMTWPDTNPLGY